MVEALVDQFLKNGYLLEESVLFKSSTSEVWQATLIDQTGTAISSGVADIKMLARKIAFAEYLERTFYRGVAKENDKVRTEWGLNLVPTACGFAAGFNKERTIFRSLGEATERWVMTKWIDDQYIIPEVFPDFDKDLDEVSKFLVKQFDSVRFFKKKVVLNLGGSLTIIPIAKTIAIKDNGVFPGSSAQVTGGTIWQHALVESFRHLLIIRNNNFSNTFPYNKINFFSKNGNLALDQINRAQKIEWPTPEIIFHKSNSIDDDYFVARTILGGWKPWNEGPLERFLF